MSFLHLSLIAGLAVVTVPIMLHLFGQRQPQLVDFPALRFVRETRQEQSSSWQLRHFLLLLLRILLLAALALALARPRVHSAMLGSILGISGVGLVAALASLIAAVAWATKRPASVWMTSALLAVVLWLLCGWWGLQAMQDVPAVPSSDSKAPVAAALIIDHGPTMEYKSVNKLRLDVAKEMATWILEQLPIDSRVGILSGAPVGGLALDPSTAKSQVDIIQTRGLHVDLLSQIRTAVDLVLADELERKEVYVITDLMSASWNSIQSDLVDLLKEHRDDVLVQIIDIGETASSNWQLGDVSSDFTNLQAGGDVTFSVDVFRHDTSAKELNNSVTVELLQEDIDPSLPVIADGKLQTAASKVVDRQVVDLKANSSTSVELRARGLIAGTHHFEIRLDQPDPLMIDNRRFATVVAREPQPTLIVADDLGLGRQLSLLVNLNETLAPDGSPLVATVRSTDLAVMQLGKYEVICLLDPPPLSIKVAQSLKEHVLGGGSLLVVLGPKLGTAATASGNPIEQLLPGSLAEIVTREPSDRSAFLVPVAISHPVFRELAEMDDEVPWFLFPIFRSWNLEPLVEGATVLANLSNNNMPLVVAHTQGRGQVITLTTPIPETEVRGSPLWNELWIGSDPWPAYGLLLGIFETLSGSNQATLNFQAGTLVSLPNDAFAWPSRYELFTPQALTRRVDAVDGLLSLDRFEQPGVFRLRGQLNEPLVRGFSVNVPADDTQLQRLDKMELDERLGEGNYRIARDQDEVESSVGQARFGRELYPLLMLFVAGLFLAEQAMSNRFYKIRFTRGRATGPSMAAKGA